MSRLSIPTVEQSLPASQPLLAAVEKQLGVVPNLMKLVGHSPAGLEGYLSLNGALNKGKLSPAEIDAARDGRSEDPRTAAAVHFARRVAESRGRVSDADLAALRAADFDEAAVLEIVLNVALNVLTNYVNNVAQTDIDFPVVTARQAA